MKRRIYWGFVLLAVLVLLLSSFLILGVSYDFYHDQVQASLKNEAHLLGRALDDAPEKQTAEELNRLARMTKLRITLIRDDGMVYYDSLADVTTMDNHQDRQEIRDSLENQTGQAIRQSQTLGEDTYYFALRLANGHVLRLARNTQSVAGVFFNMLPFVGLLFILLLIACIFIASYLTKKILQPLDRLSANVDQVNQIDHYEELGPFFRKIRAQNEIIQSQIEGLKRERDAIASISENMREGLILLDLNKNVLSINKSAIALLGAREMDYAGRHFLSICREKGFTQLVYQAFEGESQDIILQNELGCQNVFASPVLNQGEISGVIILILDITEKHRAEMLRRNFSSNVSHEIKTPLTTISGFAEMLKNNMVDNPEDIKKFASLIYTDARRLITLTEDILRLSEIEEKADGQKEWEEVDILALSRRIVENLQPLAAEKQVELRLKGEPTLIEANPSLIEELLMNLCTNGIRYNRPPGWVEVTIGSEGQEVLIGVEDTGIGIPKEHQSRIFQRFYRVDKSRSKETGGTGLGLSIVKHAVDYHKGSISLTSREDQGTKIVVRLPRCQETAGKE